MTFLLIVTGIIWLIGALALASREYEVAGGFLIGGSIAWGFVGWGIIGNIIPVHTTEWQEYRQVIKTTDNVVNLIDNSSWTKDSAIVDLVKTGDWVPVTVNEQRNCYGSLVTSNVSFDKTTLLQNLALKSLTK
jgi:hypothetical protein